MRSDQKSRRFPFPGLFIPLAIVSLLAGIWGGLLRLGVTLPLPSSGANWITYHGALMVSGFLGTVIGLERAVGLNKPWAFGAPALTGAGAILIILGHAGKLPLLLFLMGSCIYLLMTILVWKQHHHFYLVVMVLGALAWCAGNLLQVLNWPISNLVAWWMAFPGLTILGERLELSRFQKPLSWARPSLHGVLSITCLALIAGLVNSEWGQALLGASLVMQALWLLIHDICWRTIRLEGLPRFTAVCLLSGYVWLGTTGVLMLLQLPLIPGSSYDAALHAYFLGFVFSMIFGHAPIIFPAIVKVSIPFVRRFYLHLALLHLSLALRFYADVAMHSNVRQWSAIMNGVVLALFLLNTLSAILFTGKNHKPEELSTITS